MHLHIYTYQHSYILIYIHTMHIYIHTYIGADAFFKDESGRSSLHYAVRSGCLELLALLCDQGADLTEDLQLGDWLGRTPLHISAMFGKEDCCRYLLESAVEVDKQVCMYVCTVCMYCMYVCSVCMYCMYVCSVCLYVCMYVCTVCMYCMYVLFVCMYCMYVLYVCTVCMYCLYVCTVCMYV